MESKERRVAFIPTSRRRGRQLCILRQVLLQSMKLIGEFLISVTPSTTVGPVPNPMTKVIPDKRQMLSRQLRQNSFHIKVNPRNVEKVFQEKACFLVSDHIEKRQVFMCEPGPVNPTSVIPRV